MSSFESTLFLLLGMIALQHLWLAAIWWTRTTERLDKVLRTGLLTLTASLGILVLVWIAVRPGPPPGPWFTSSVPTPTVLVFLCSLVLLISIFYARWQRVWRFDEEGNERAARMIAEKGLRVFFQQYAELPWLGMQHPPLIPLIGGLMLRLFPPSLLLLRLVSIAFLMGTVVVTYLVGCMLYGPPAGLLGALLLLAFPLVWRLGSVAMLDVPAMFWFGLAIWLALRTQTTLPPIWPSVGAGLAAGLGILTRYTVALFYPVLLTLVLLGALTWPVFVVILLASLIVVAPWLVAAARLGVLAKQFGRMVIYSGQKPGLANPRQEYKGLLGQLGITRGWRMRLRLESMVSRLPSAVGAYSLPLLALFVWTSVDHLGPSDAILLAWIAVPFVLLLLLMPDHRYFLLIFPALALGMARGLGASRLWAAPPSLLGLLFCAGNLYLFVDWQRRGYLFSSRGI